jgi:hypothetical protein
MTAIEAFSCGTPVVGSRLGAMASVIANGRTGLHFTPLDAEDLARKTEWAWAHPEEILEMGRQARREYEARYTATRNYTMLLEIYQRAIRTYDERNERVTTGVASGPDGMSSVTETTNITHQLSTGDEGGVDSVNSVRHSICSSMMTLGKGMRWRPW